MKKLFLLALISTLLTVNLISCKNEANNTAPPYAYEKMALYTPIPASPTTILRESTKELFGLSRKIMVERYGPELQSSSNGPIYTYGDMPASFGADDVRGVFQIIVGGDPFIFLNGITRDMTFEQIKKDMGIAPTEGKNAADGLYTASYLVDGKYEIVLSGENKDSKIRDIKILLK